MKVNPTAVGFKIVCVVKEKCPLSILEMTLITTEVWKKIVSFEKIIVVDLVSVISSEISIDTTTACIESSKVKESFMSDLPNMHTLSGLLFLHSNGQKANNLASDDLKDRITDLAFFNWAAALERSP